LLRGSKKAICVSQICFRSAQTRAMSRFGTRPVNTTSCCTPSALKLAISNVPISTGLSISSS